MLFLLTFLSSFERVSPLGWFTFLVTVLFRSSREIPHKSGQNVENFIKLLTIARFEPGRRIFFIINTDRESLWIRYTIFKPFGFILLFFKFIKNRFKNCLNKLFFFTTVNISDQSEADFIQNSVIILFV